MADYTGYGIMRGLNEAYGSYRDREREIEDKGRRALVDERLEKEGARQEEEYQYGISQRGRQERAADIAIEGADINLQQAKGTERYTVTTASTLIKVYVNSHRWL